MFKIVACLVHANLLFAIDIDCNLLPRIAYKSLCIANTMRRVYIHYVMCTYVHIYISRKKKKLRTKSGETRTERGIEKKGERERERRCIHPNNLTQAPARFWISQETTGLSIPAYHFIPPDHIVKSPIH